MNNSDRKVLRVIKYNESYIKNQIENGVKDTYKDNNGFTKLNTLWYIKQELKYYKEILGKDKRKLPIHLKELYKAI